MTPATPRLDLARPPATGTVLAWLAVFAGSLLAAAALTPLVHAGATALGLPRGWTFPRVFNRVAMAAALAALVACRRWTGWRAALARLAAPRARLAAAEAAGGFAAGLAAVGAGVAWAFATGRLGPGLVPFGFAPGRLASLLVGALVAALLEELFFRGMMLASLAARWSWTAAALVSSALYSAVHLLAPDRGFTASGFDPAAGFRYLVRLLGGSLEAAALPPLVGLFLAGLLLALVVRRTGSLWIAVGLHAGWALSFQVLRQATHVPHPIPGAGELARVHHLLGTPWAWASIALAAGIVWAAVSLHERRRATHAGLAAQ